MKRKSPALALKIALTPYLGGGVSFILWILDFMYSEGCSPYAVDVNAPLSWSWASILSHIAGIAVFSVGFGQFYNGEWAKWLKFLAWSALSILGLTVGIGFVNHLETTEVSSSLDTVGI